MLKVLLITLLLYSQLGLAVTLNPVQRERFTRSVNVMASQVMFCYKNILLLTPSQKAVKLPYWRTFRRQYPNKINTIEITKTDLKENKKANEKQFIVWINLANKLSKQTRKDVFVFKQNQLMSVNSQMVNKKAFTANKKYNSDYFQYREVAYTWLAYLDGAKLSASERVSLESSQFNLHIGTKTWQGLTKKVVNLRKKNLFKGGHTLRSVVLNKVLSSKNRKVIDLIVQWQGVDENGTSVIAKIKQTLAYKINKNHTWTLLTINEKHLLPDTEPWMGLLC